MQKISVIWVVFSLICIRAFLLRVVNARRCFFLAFLTQKLVPSRIANAIIFCIDEQCGLKFETALFTEGKSYIIFLFHGTHLLFFLYFFFLLFLVFLRLSFLLSNHISFSFLHSPASTTENHGGSGLAKL